MTKRNNKITIADEELISKIYFIRGHKVMLDSDLAALYKVETKRLKEAVKRNLSRFPTGFMFELTADETQNLRSQIATSSLKHGGTRYLPMVFTEHGVLMLSSVLNSEKAIQINIQIIKVFIRMRQVLAENAELKIEIERIKNKLDNYDKNMSMVFQYIDELSEKKETEGPMEKIGFKIGSGRK